MSFYGIQSLELVASYPKWVTLHQYDKSAIEDDFFEKWLGRGELDRGKKKRLGCAEGRSGWAVQREEESAGLCRGEFVVVAEGRRRLGRGKKKAGQKEEEAATAASM
ncbi:hypothetical protein ACFE04_002935 [Oxalis oulophora]